MERKLLAKTAVFALALGLSLGVAGVAVASTPALNTTPCCGATISEKQAFDIADAEYTGPGEFTDIELETEDGVLVYELEFIETDGDETEVLVNASTGAIVADDSGDDDADTDEDDGDTEDEDDEDVDDDEDLDDDDDEDVDDDGDVDDDADDAEDAAENGNSGDADLRIRLQALIDLLLKLLALLQAQAGS